jgi:tetratricopeptide (TPR) repeat protein
VYSGLEIKTAWVCRPMTGRRGSTHRAHREHSTAGQLKMDIISNPARARFFVLVSGAIAIASLAALGATLLVRGGTRGADPIAAAGLAKDTPPKPDIQSSKIDFTSDKARRVRAAIKHGDYSTARQIAEDVLKTSRIEGWRFSPFSDLMSGISDVNDPAFASQLDLWVMRSKGDAMPLLIRAQYDYDMAWYKRSHKFIRDISASSLTAFAEYSRLGVADVDRAIQSDDSNPYAFYLKLRLLRGSGTTEALRTAFEEAVAKYPGYYDLYRIYLAALEPKWGGSVKDMYAFVDRYAGHAAQYAPLRLLYLSLYRDLLDSASTACTNYWPDADKVARCVAQFMGRAVTPELNDHVLASLQLYDHAKKAEFGFAIHDILVDMLETSGGDAYSGAMLQMAATSMHSNTQLSEDKPGRNDYVIDESVAESWYQKGFYDNALKKAHEALKDIDNTAFPRPEEKALAIAGIYELIGQTYEYLHQYADMIAYDEAAIKLGGRSDERLLICYGDYELKNYSEALRACTAATGDQQYDAPARYWRGLAHRDLGQPDAALRDLAAVADSEHRFRSSAAIAMSVIDFDKNDVHGALNVLNRYPYLYDPKATNRDDVAVSYNNRCYAYMRLGELQKALNDCNESLKFGNLPDAYRKKQELLRRLGAHETGL